MAAVILGLSAGAVAPAAVLSQHSGRADPTTEGFALAPFPSGAGYTQAEVTARTGPVTETQPLNGGPSTSVDAWRINDDNGGTAVSNNGEFLFYLDPLTQPQVTDANTNGFSFTNTLRVVSATDPLDFGVASFYRVVRTYVPGGNDVLRDYRLLFGYVNGNVTVRTFETPAGGGADVTKDYTVTTGGGYHTYELRAGALSGGVQSARLFVDGVQTNVTTTGINLLIANATPNDPARILFGGVSSADTGEGNYNLVRFESVPEPSGLALLGLGGLALARRRARR